MARKSQAFCSHCASSRPSFLLSTVECVHSRMASETSFRPLSLFTAFSKTCQPLRMFGTHAAADPASGDASAVTIFAKLLASYGGSCTSLQSLVCLTCMSPHRATLRVLQRTSPTNVQMGADPAMTPSKMCGNFIRPHAASIPPTGRRKRRVTVTACQLGARVLLHARKCHCQRCGAPYDPPKPITALLCASRSSFRKVISSA